MHLCRILNLCTNDTLTTKPYTSLEQPTKIKFYVFFCWLIYFLSEFRIRFSKQHTHSKCYYPPPPPRQMTILNHENLCYYSMRFFPATYHLFSFCESMNWTKRFFLVSISIFQMMNLCYVYYLSKLSEFADTIFFVLKKKKSQLTWLHLYHHSLTPLEAWILVKFLSGKRHYIKIKI